MAWMRTNATTLVGWVVVVALALGGKMSSIDTNDSANAATRLEVVRVVARVTAVETDVALLEQSVRRQEAIVTRQEDAQRELDRLVIELRTLVKVGRDGG